MIKRQIKLIGSALMWTWLAWPLALFSFLLITDDPTNEQPQNTTD